MSLATRPAALPTLLCLALSPAMATSEDALRRVDQALSKGRSVEERADILAHLAWPAEKGDPEVTAFARTKITQYAGHGTPALRAAVRWVRPDQQADVVAALLESFKNVEAGVPKDYRPALEEAVWFGTREARKLAIGELSRFRYRPALVTLVDAAWEDPGLVPDVVAALRTMGDDRARFFLEKVLLEGGPGLREAAATALATIGGRALLPLKAAVRAGNRELRLVAVRALLPAATVDDLSILHEYVNDHPDDDPATAAAVREVALALEKLLAGQEAAGSAPPVAE